MVKPTASMGVVLFLGVMANSVFGVAQPPTEPNTPQALAEYLRYAALQNAALKAAFEDWKAALEQIPQAKALPDPRFTYGYFIEEVETRVGPQRQRFNLTQTFPWFGTIAARTDAAAAAAQAAYLRYEARKLSLFNEVKNAFYEYVYLASAIDIAKENLVLLRHFEEVARAKYIAATAQHPDVIRAQVAVAKLEDRLKSLQELRGPIVARLNAALNRPTQAALPWPRRPETSAVQVTPEALFAALRRQNPQLGAKEFELHGAQSRIELAKKKFYPEVGLGLDWIDTGHAYLESAHLAPELSGGRVAGPGDGPADAARKERPGKYAAGANRAGPVRLRRQRPQVVLVRRGAGAKGRGIGGRFGDGLYGRHRRLPQSDRRGTDAAAIPTGAGACLGQPSADAESVGDARRRRSDPAGRAAGVAVGCGQRRRTVSSRSNPASTWNCCRLPIICMNTKPMGIVMISRIF
jgi:hypothetical protein